MMHSLTKNWPAKIASLLAAYAIWYVINQNINDGVAFRFTSEQARDQQMLQQELQQKWLEISILQEKINKSMTENAPKAIPVEENKEEAPAVTPPSE